VFSGNKGRDALKQKSIFIYKAFCFAVSRAPLLPYMTGKIRKRENPLSPVIWQPPPPPQPPLLFLLLPVFRNQKQKRNSPKGASKKKTESQP
jgi:hypothetical protein